MGKEKIVFISVADIFYPNGQGVYAKNVLQQIAIGLNTTNKDCEKIFFIPKSNFTNYHESLNVFSDKVIWLPQKKVRSVFKHLYTQFFIFFYLIKYRPNAVVFSVKPTLISIVFAKYFLKFKSIVLVEGHGGKTLRTLGGKNTIQLGEYVYKKIFEQADFVFAAYQAALSWVKSYNNSCHIEIISCGVDTSLFKPINREKKIHAKEINIGYVGSFRNEHRLDFLLCFIKKNPLYRACLIGEGNERNRIEQLAEKWMITERVEFLGHRKQCDIPNLIFKCDLMWAFTDLKHWGVPIKAFEYLSCEKLIITARRPEFEFVDVLKFGILLENEDVDTLKLKLQLFLSEKRNELESNKSSHKYIESNFSWQRFRKIADFLAE